MHIESGMIAFRPRGGIHKQGIAFASLLLCASCSGPWGCPNPATSSEGSVQPAVKAAIYAEASDPYAAGPLDVQRIDLDTCSEGCPFPSTIYAPGSGGLYAVLAFEHGLVVDHNLYSEILTHVASHGIIAIAPQTYRPGTLPIGIPSIEEEVGRFRGVLDWAAGNLSRVTGVGVDMSALAVGGHSRGGPVAWLIAREEPGRFKAVIGMDPVDGAGGIYGPPTLVGEFDLGAPSLIIGAGLSDVPAGATGTPCAFGGYDYGRFFEVTASPVWQALIRSAGHLDVFDYCEGYPYCSFCTHGLDPPATRRLTAGLMTAFLRATLQGDPAGYAVLSDPALAPLPFELTAK